ncbi:MAG: STAS domain-containing protein [Bacteroidetes bacterium]|nr:STAS domain-containing protein [Bacteroidota bacterium]MCW5893957.1 STAS domain-containing protein [Bacteroidota bacterium]
MISIRELTEKGLTVIEPGPRLTLENADEFLRLVQALPAAVGPILIVNMREIKIVDSSGVGALVNARKHMQSVNGFFALVDLRPEIGRMFKLMNLHNVFEMYESEELAYKDILAHRR